MLSVDSSSREKRESCFGNQFFESLILKSVEVLSALGFARSPLRRFLETKNGQNKISKD